VDGDPSPSTLFIIMQTFFHSVSAVIVVMMLMSVGFFMGKGGWLKAEHKQLLTRLIIKIALPCMCINGIQKNFTKEMLDDIGALLIVPILSILATMLIAYIVGRRLKLPRNRIGVFIVMASLSNSIFIGAPMCLELFGDASTTYVMCYYLVNTMMFQSLGVAFIEYSGRSEGTSTLTGLKNVVTNPPFIAGVASFLMLLLNIKLPPILMSFTNYLGNIVSPLGLIYTGLVMYEIGFKNLNLKDGMTPMMVLRFIISPALCLLLCHFFGIAGLAANVLVVETAMPTMTQSVIMSAAMGADEEYAAKGAVLSVLACFVVIPLLMVIL